MLRRYEHRVLVLQGGGALGAYQAGLYAGLAEAGVAPDWVTGVSIGAVNAALIAGNPPAQRLATLEQFWELVSSSAPLVPPASFDPMRPALNRLSAAASLAFGVPGLFAPRVPPPLLAPDGSVDALSVYDISPLAKTLGELVDFDLINRKDVRLSIGAVNVRTGNSVYFDNRERRIGPEHVLASSALPPGLPPVMIDGEPHVLKHVHIDNDWTMRFFHETSCIPLDVWRAGLMDVLPERIDHGMVGAAGGLGGFVPPLVMGSIYGGLGSYAVGLVALAVVAALVLALAAQAARRPSAVN